MGTLRRLSPLGWNSAWHVENRLTTTAEVLIPFMLCATAEYIDQAPPAATIAPTPPRKNRPRRTRPFIHAEKNTDTKPTTASPKEPATAPAVSAEEAKEKAQERDGVAALIGTTPPEWQPLPR